MKPSFDRSFLVDLDKPTKLVHAEGVSRQRVPFGYRAVVMSDFLLSPGAGSPRNSSADRLIQLLTTSEALGVVVLAGNTFDLDDLQSDSVVELPTVQESSESQPAGNGSTTTEVKSLLGVLPELVQALKVFMSEPSHKVICIPGRQDAALGLPSSPHRRVLEEAGVEFATAVELEVLTAGGSKLVRIEAGPDGATSNSTSSTSSNIARSLAKKSSFLGDADRLSDSSCLGRFIASSIIYKKLIYWSWLLLLPLAAALLLRMPLAYVLANHAVAHHLAPPSTATHAGIATIDHRLEVISIAILASAVLLGGVLTILARRAWTTVSAVLDIRPGIKANDTARQKARQLLGEGYAGLITSNTLQAELEALSNGFYANTGANTEVVEEHPSRLGLPPIFLRHYQSSALEIEAGAELHVRLLLADQTIKRSGSWLERLLARETNRIVPPEQSGQTRTWAGRSRQIKETTWYEGSPLVVASYPHGPSWPPEPTITKGVLRRRVGAAAIAVAGVVDLITAVTPPLRGRLHLVLSILPLGVSQAAAALVALAGLLLIALARGIRRGQHRAWLVGIAVLAATVVAHLVRGGDIEASGFSLAVLMLLLFNRQSFTAPADRLSTTRATTLLVIGIIGIPLMVSGAIEAALPLDPDHKSLPFIMAWEAVVERLVGYHSILLPSRVDDFLSPSLLAIGFALAVVTLWLLTRPVADHRHSPRDDASATFRARQLVASYGKGTLDYFALRSDKKWFFTRDSLVAYAVINGVCLVSPDPIGPPQERQQVWLAFRKYADAHGWTTAVIGASEEWLPIYRLSNMHDLYIGDEALVDVDRFSLEGGRMKGLRQAYNRIKKYGYSVSFYDPSSVSSDLIDEVKRIMVLSRRGQAERGFSMTLGRIFDPEDKGLLLAVARDRTGKVVAYCQYVPAPSLNGFSLDVMRRDPSLEHPNGLIDFVLVSTIFHLRSMGYRTLGLNFASFRAVLADETEGGATQRLERWALKRLSGTMQIESLWRFNAKYEPEWLPRYAVYENSETVLPTAMAIARAEALLDLPLIGRFFTPKRSVPSFHLHK